MKLQMQVEQVFDCSHLQRPWAIMLVLLQASTLGPSGVASDPREQESGFSGSRASGRNVGVGRSLSKIVQPPMCQSDISKAQR